MVYPMAPPKTLHSWVEVGTETGWVNPEGFILDMPFVATLQWEFIGTDSHCGYGSGTECLNAPPVEWVGDDTYIQTTRIAQDFGAFDTPDAFYREHSQNFGFLRDLLYRHVIRHWMNARVRAIRLGRVPRFPGVANPNHRHGDKTHAA